MKQEDGHGIAFSEMATHWIPRWWYFRGERNQLAAPPLLSYTLWHVKPTESPKI